MFYFLLTVSNDAGTPQSQTVGLDESKSKPQINF